MKLEICERKLIVKSNILNDIQDFSYFTRVPQPLVLFDGKYFRGGNLDFSRFSLFCDVFSSFIFLGQNPVQFHSVSSQICHLFLCKNTSFWSIFVKKGGFKCAHNKSLFKQELQSCTLETSFFYKNKPKTRVFTQK